MDQDTFGNLTDWGRVLERLDELTRRGGIEAHQDDLAMLLRYRGNWRLREAALECIPSITEPKAELIREVCQLMLDENLYFQARILAAEALGAAMDHLGKCSDSQTPALRKDIRDQMHALLGSQDLPVVHQAARRVLPAIE